MWGKYQKYKPVPKGRLVRTKTDFICYVWHIFLFSIPFVLFIKIYNEYTFLFCFSACDVLVWLYLHVIGVFMNFDMLNGNVLGLYLMHINVVIGFGLVNGDWTSSVSNMCEILLVCFQIKQRHVSQLWESIWTLRKKFAQCKHSYHWGN